MRRFLSILLLLVMLFSSYDIVQGAGSCVRSDKELVRVDGRTERVYITLTCTGDGSITAYTLTPSTEGVQGWYLYNVTTNPGSSAPTAAYDITLVVDGEDIAGSLLNDRSASATETVAISPTTKGYHMADQAIAITFANQTANPSTIVMKLRFTSN